MMIPNKPIPENMNEAGKIAQAFVEAVDAGVRSGKMDDAEAMLEEYGPALVNTLCSYDGKERHLPLTHFAAHGNLEAVMWLTWQGADVNKLSGRPDVRDMNGTDTCNTALHHAAVNGHSAVATLLLQKGAEVDAKNHPSQVTPLYVAVLKGQPEVAGVLMANHANPDAKVPEGLPTPRALATQLAKTKPESYGAVLEALQHKPEVHLDDRGSLRRVGHRRTRTLLNTIAEEPETETTPPPAAGHAASITTVTADNFDQQWEVFRGLVEIHNNTVDQCQERMSDVQEKQANAYSKILQDELDNVTKALDVSDTDEAVDRLNDAFKELKAAQKFSTNIMMNAKGEQAPNWGGAPIQAKPSPER
jgi:hypothetical protein